MDAMHSRLRFSSVTPPEPDCLGNQCRHTLGVLLKQRLSKALGEEVSRVVFGPNPGEVNSTVSKKVLDIVISQRDVPVAIGRHLRPVHLDAGLIVNMYHRRTRLDKSKLSEQGTLVDNTFAALGAGNKFSFHRAHRGNGLHLALRSNNTGTDLNDVASARSTSGFARSPIRVRRGRDLNGGALKDKTTGRTSKVTANFLEIVEVINRRRLHVSTQLADMPFNFGPSASDPEERSHP